MKKQSILIICLLFLMLSSCRDASNSHTGCIDFLGIPIEGNVDDFGKKLSAQGYRCGGEDETYHTLVFDGNYRNKYASIILDFDERNRNIFGVRVHFPEDKPDFNDLLNEYVDKYGECKFVATGYSSQYSWKVDNGTFRLECFGNNAFNMNWFIAE